MKKLIELALSNPNSRFWYAQEKRFLKRYAKKRNWDFYRFCDIIAITSPRTQLSRNWKLACNYMAGENFYTPALPSVISGLKYYEQSGIIRGPKTSRFSLALQGDESAIVLDIYMARILRFDYEAMYQPENYLRLCRRIEKLAQVLGYTPAQTQACLWINYLQANNRSNGLSYSQLEL